MVGVVNVVDSLISREVDCGVYLNCGREVAVASTKAFSSQVLVLSLISVWFAQIKNTNIDKRIDILKKINRLQSDILSTIDSNKQKCKEVAKILVKKIVHLF